MAETYCYFPNFESLTSRDGGPFSKHECYLKENMSVWIPWEVAAEVKDTAVRGCSGSHHKVLISQCSRQSKKQKLIANGQIFRDENKISWPVDRPWSATKTQKRLK